MGNIVQVIDLHKVFMVDGKKLPVLDHVNLEVAEGEFVSIIGPSGCGKSTLFRILAGLETDFEGKVLVNGQETIDAKPCLAYMLQKDLLLPWRTIWQNITLPLELSGDMKNADEEFLYQLALEFGLSGFLKAYPNELSGGMRQRAALLRTWLMKGDMMLLDEPFGALDALTRYKIQDWLTDVWENHKKTVVFITHDIEEAIYLSDRVLVMSKRPGNIVEDIPIKFQRPREREMLYSSTFLEYKEHLMDVLEKFS